MSESKLQHLPLESFAVGDTLRIFQSKLNDGEIFYTENTSKEDTSVSGQIFSNRDDEKIKFKYLMSNNTKYVLPKVLSDDFKNFVNETVDLESTLTSKKSLNYYDVDKFEFNNSKNKIFQIGKKCYILNKNSYVDELSGEINIKKFKDDQPYTLTQFFGKNDNVNISGVWNYYKNNEDFFLWYKKYGTKASVNYSLSSEFFSEYLNNEISSYISKNYSDNFFNDTQYVDNKSIPIYDLNDSSLEKLYVIKLFNKQCILDVLIDNELINLSSNFLFNSETYDYDTKDFDSIAVINVYDYIINNFNEDEAEEKLNKFFKDIFSYIPKDSFYRLLIPVGHINVLNNNEESNLNDEQQYMYSIDLNDNSSDNKLINYFSLKNLNNPELNYDYSLEKNKNFNSLSPSYFTFDNNLKNKIINIYKTLIYDPIIEYSINNNLNYMSSLFIYENNLDNELKNVFFEHYKNTSEERLSSIFDAKDFSDLINVWAYQQAFKMYMYEKYNLNLDENSMIITKNDIYNLLDNNFKKFDKEIEKIKNIFNDETFINDFASLIELIKNGSGQYEYLGVFTYLNNLDNVNKKFLRNDEINKILNLLDNKNILNNKISKDIKLNFESSLYFNKVNEMINSLSKLSSNFQLNENKKYYLSMFEDLYKHENSMEVNGYLNGFRIYNNCGSNENDDIWLSYNYNVLLDENFIKENNIDVNILNDDALDNIISQKINLYDKNNIPHLSKTAITNKIKLLNIDEEIYLSSLMVNSINDYSSLNQVIKNNFNLINTSDELIKLTQNRYIILNNNSNNKVKNYIKMLKTIRNIPFGEYIKGQHYYKKEGYSKSNIFSIDVKNSGFNYTLYSFNEVKKILEERFNKKFDISTGNNLNDFVNIINSSEFCKVDFNVVYEEKLNYEPLKITDNLEKIQFFKCKSGDIQKEYDLIIVKNKMQEHFKSAIRKSIKRYIPANSVLWKIQYSGK